MRKLERFFSALLVVAISLTGVSWPSRAYAGPGASNGAIFQAFGGTVDQGSATVPIPTNGQILTYSTTTNSWRAANAASGGVTTITGTPLQITVTGTTTPTLSLPAAITLPGSLTTGGTGQHIWGTGGSPSATSPQILGPTDAGIFISAGATAATTGRTFTLTAGAGLSNGDGGTFVSIAGAGQGSGAGGAWSGTGGAAGATGTGGAATVTGGAGVAGGGGLVSTIGGAGVGTNQAAGGYTASSGPSTGTAAGALLFKVPPTIASSATSNTPATVLTINNVGLVYLGLQNVTDVGNVSLTASQGGSTSGAGGGFTATAGASGTAGGAAGAVSIKGGANLIASGSTNGGAVTIAGGAANGTTSTGSGGAVSSTGGTGGTTSGNGGAVSSTGGTPGAGGSGSGGLATAAGGGAVGTDQLAGGLVLSSGRSTGLGGGAGTGTTIKVQSSYSGLTGTTLQSTCDRMVFGCKSLVLSNTSATATAFVSLSVPTGGSAAGTCYYTVVTTDGTEFSAASGTINFGAVNKAGALSIGTATVQAETIASSTAATLNTTGGPTQVISGTSLLLKVTPVFAGTNAAGVTKCTVTWTVILHGLTTATVQ